MHLFQPTFVILLIILPQENIGLIHNRDAADSTVRESFLDTIGANKVQTPSNYSYCKFDIRNEEDYGTFRGGQGFSRGKRSAFTRENCKACKL